jgi:hypothetical protein
MSELTIERFEPTPEQAEAATPLIERAYALTYDPGKPPPADELCMQIGEYPICARGNVSVIQGKSKAGKSAAVSAVLGAAMRGTHAASGDTLCMEWAGDANGAVIHFDTEQSPADWHALVGRSVVRSGLPGPPDRFVSFPLVRFTRSERLELLRQVMRKEADEKGGTDAVVIDGIADLCASPNDEAEALERVSEIHALSQTYECAIVCVLHENPGTDQGKTRGHLGSELNRKAFANLRVDKDAGTSVSTLWGTDMRKRDIPREQGFCFAWDDAAGMHAFQGRAGKLKAAKKEAEAIAREHEFFAPLFEAIGTNGACPDSTPDDLVAAYRDIIGTKKPPSRDAMKKKMQRAESLGVLRKTTRNTWTINPIGTNGK